VGVRFLNLKFRVEEPHPNLLLKGEGIDKKNVGEDI